MIGTIKSNKLLALKIALHSAYWIFIVGFFGLFWGSANNNYGVTFFTELVLLPGKMLATYIYVYLTIPYLLLKRKYLLFVLTSIASLALIALLQRLLVCAFLIPYNKVFDPTLPFFDIYQIMHLIVDINTITVIPIGAKLAQVWYKNVMASKELERSKLEAELNFLKNQVQPHFLFNTLNNLYGLIVTKSDKAEVLLLKLSDLLRYMLYQTNSNSTLLESEIKHLKDYIEIEQLRYGDKVDVCFNVYGSLEGREIAPLILLPFVENCFKHGVLRASEQAWIRIDLSVSESLIEVIIENSIPQLNEPKPLIPPSGIGMQNVIRRLDIIYSGCYELKVNSSIDVYSVQLKLHL